MTNQKHLPVYQQFIQLLKAGLNALDDSARQQIEEFVLSQQHANGSFVNRSGKPDFYYSVFGFWLSSALNLTTAIDRHNQFLVAQNELPAGTINKLAMFLIKAGMPGSNKKIPVFKLLKIILKEKTNINIAYRLFLLMLIIDAQNGPKAFFYFVARIWLSFYKTPENLPCSILAAFTFAKKETGLNYQKEQKKILTYFVEGEGFVSFEHIKNPDMLSTAVALFVLKNTGFDLRTIAPGCLNFVENNYDSGAFLSGDGDKTRDLEYTFYGLLALGTLVRNEK